MKVHATFATLTTAALMLASAGAVQAAGSGAKHTGSPIVVADAGQYPWDNDDNRYQGNDDDRGYGDDGYHGNDRYYGDDRYDRPYHHPRRHHDNRCGAMIRTAGKKNLVRVFARNSAIFGWKREARYVYGKQYGIWNNARHRRIICKPEGIFLRCVAKANPCRS